LGNWHCAQIHARAHNGRAYSGYIAETDGRNAGRWNVCVSGMVGNSDESGGHFGFSLVPFGMR